MSEALLLVDDHPLFRRGVRDLIVSRCNLYKEVLEADNGHDALKMTSHFSPKSVVLDISMPGVDGLRTLELIKHLHPHIRCVILSMYDKPEFIVQARRKGAQGYILKTDSDDAILECLHCIENGEHYVSSALGSNLDQQVLEQKTCANDFSKLTDREKEILALIAKNHTSKEIAHQFSLSLRTVQNHRVNICKKLRIVGSNTLLKIAIENQALLVQ